MEARMRSIEYVCLACGCQGVTIALDGVPSDPAERDAIICPSCGWFTRLTRRERRLEPLKEPA